MLKIILIAAIIIVAILLVLYLYCHFENTRFNVTEYTITTDKISKDVTICVLSDLHNYVYGENNCRLMLAIDKIKPDIVVSSGDMVEAGRFVKGTDKTIDFLCDIKSKYPFFYGIGNHETMLYNDGYKKYDKAKEAFIKAIEEKAHSGIDIAPVKNGHMDLESNIRLLGLQIETKYFRKFKLSPISADYIEEKLGKIDKDKFNILIGHDPNQIDAYADYGADLVLSGHVHGGMIALPGGRGLVSTLFTLFPPYYAGIYKKANTQMIVSRGIGNHSVHVRINNRAEILKINIKKG